MSTDTTKVFRKELTFKLAAKNELSLVLVIFAGFKKLAKLSNVEMLHERLKFLNNTIYHYSTKVD